MGPPDVVVGRLVTDLRLGELVFPDNDQVMAPWIEESGSWEIAEGWWLDHALAPGMTFVNVGANVGYFVLWASRLVGEAGRVIAIEPDPENYALLCENIARHGARNVTVYQTAASDRTGVTRLYRNPVNSGDHRVFDPTIAADSAEAGFAESGNESIDVPAVRLDELLAGERVDVVMSDTQGWDQHVIRGMSATVARWHPAILCEFKPAWISSLGERPEGVLHAYADMGYRVGAIEAGVPAGQWTLRETLDYCQAPGRPHATLELIGTDQEPTIRATPADGFWRPESNGVSRWWWLTERDGSIWIRGTAGRTATLTLQAIPAPGVEGHATIGDQQLRFGEPTELRIPVRLGPSGSARVPIHVWSAPGDVPQDPRTMFVAVANPTVTDA